MVNLRFAVQNSFFLKKLNTLYLYFFFFNDTAPPEISTLPLHDALPIFLAPSTPRGPPLSVVFALWLSMMPADGIGLRPMVWRASLTRLRLMQCQVPSSRQR